MGLMYGSIRTLPFSLDNPANGVPVDMCVNALLACAWAVAEQRQSDVNNEALPPIYNFCLTSRNPLSWQRFFALAAKYGKLYPPVKAMWCLASTDNPRWYWHTMYKWTLHILPAALVDTVAWLTGRRSGMLRLYGRIHRGMEVMTDCWRLSQWEFGTEHLVELRAMLTARDRELFDFDVDSLDWEGYMRDYVLGVRKFLLKDSIETLPEARRRSSRLQWINFAMKFGAVSAVGWACYRGLERVIVLQKCPVM